MGFEIVAAQEDYQEHYKKTKRPNSSQGNKGEGYCFITQKFVISLKALDACKEYLLLLGTLNIFLYTAKVSC